MRPNHANPDGFFESSDLAAFNDRLLATIGHSYWTPPREGGEFDRALKADFAAEATTRFAELFGNERGWVWKDPRLAILLPAMPNARRAAVVHPVRSYMHGAFAIRGASISIR